LEDIEHRNALDIFQKSRGKWVVEWDENSKYFHLLLKQNRRRQAMQVKNVLFEYFRDKFGPIHVERPEEIGPRLARLSQLESDMLEDVVTIEEIKSAVGMCGGDKAPGPDGFSFNFIKKYWDVLSSDIMGYVQEFFQTGVMPRGCNPSFITLIPKVINPMLVKDFRRISLIGMQYKIIAKVLAIRLAKVVGSVVSEEQTALIKGR